MIFGAIFGSSEISLEGLLLRTRHSSPMQLILYVIHRSHEYYKLFPSGCVFI